jgi:energy-coupling factor transporter transmembrane protein EcfT
MMEYVPRRSLIHDLHPLTKLVWSLILLVSGRRVVACD